MAKTAEVLQVALAAEVLQVALAARAIIVPSGKVLLFFFVCRQSSSRGDP